ncbi:hypothetical protein L3Y34_013684 [Caenorhabditis briggsae]|nr:hypothetical protein L3Y34_013684 [Caenorhabditis briggsae]
MEFDALLQNALKSEAVFNPNSVKDGMTKHSKYAYLVHWKNFPFEQRTWEPEENLRTDDSVPEALAKFYKSNNYPNTYEEIDKDYGANMWDDLMVAWRKVADYEYLYSPDEKREKKEAEERKKREEQKKLEVRKKKIAARAESEAPQKKEKRRVIIESDPDEQNETSRKKSEKSNKRAASLAGSTESAKKQRSESVPPAVPLNKPRRIAPSQPKVAEFKKPLKEFPVKVEGVRPTRPFTAALWNLKFRRCRSAESLNNFFFKGAEIEMFEGIWIESTLSIKITRPR